MGHFSRALRFVYNLLVSRMRSQKSMNRLFTQKEKSIDEIDYVAVAICAVNNIQHHVGILHKLGDNSSVELLHLAWHRDLRNGPPSEKYHWVAPQIPSPRLRQVAARCRQIFRANPDSIPYAFSPSNDCFDETTGQFLLGPTRCGLTCATFVVAVFRSTGVDVLKPETWPVGLPEDLAWQDFVLHALENCNTPASQEHIDSVRNERGGIRIRPEHVAAAVTISPQPAEYASTEILSKQIVDRLHH